MVLNVLVCWRVPFTGIKGSSTTFAKLPNTISSLPPNFSFGTIASTVLATDKPRLIHQISRSRSVISHSREHVSMVLESNGMCFTTPCPTFCIVLGNEHILSQIFVETVRMPWFYTLVFIEVIWTSKFNDLDSWMNTFGNTMYVPYYLKWGDLVYFKVFI